MNIGNRIKERRKELHLSADAVAEKLGVSRSTVFRYENGDIEKFPTQKLAEIANALNTTPGYLMGWDKKEAPKIINIYEQLETDRQQVVYDCAEKQLNEQNHPNVHNIEESKQTYTIDVLGAVSAGTGEWLDGQQPEPVTVEGPLPHYDFAVRVNGISMTPTFSDGEILFVDKVESASDVRNNQFVIAEINGNAYVKKLFVSNEGVRLISLNKDYEDIIIHDYDDYRIIGTVVI